MSPRQGLVRRMLIGPRGDAVCLTGAPLDEGETCLTVELAEKWYGLCLVRARKDGVLSLLEVEELDFGIFDELVEPPLGPSFCDHVPSPLFVERLAEEKGWRLDPLASDLIVGRWHSEIVGWRSPGGPKP